MPESRGGTLSSLNPAGPCLTCGTAHTGKFCPACGEQRLSSHDYALGHFVEHALETFTHFDAKSLLSLKVLVLQPGKLTRDFLDGRRKPYVGPVQLFLIVSVVFALLIGFSGFSPFNTPLLVQERIGPFAAAKRQLIADEILKRGLTRPEFEHAFDARTSLQAKTLIFAMIPVMALVAAAVYGFRRYFFECLVFSTHFYTFVLLLLLADTYGFGLLAGVAVRTGTPFNSGTFELASSVCALLVIALYLRAALRHTFGDGRAAATIRALALTAAFFPILQSYRLLLFFVTLKFSH